MKKLLPVITAILILVLVAPVACAKAPESAPAFAPPPMPAPAPAPRISLEKGDSSGSALPTVNEERMIVRNGDISLVVKDVLEARDAIARLAVSLDGYVVSSSIAGEEEGMRGNIAIRVPDNKFEEALSEFRNLAVRVRSESTGSRDVTEEYVDLKSRLKNAEATESQYLEVLEKATDVEDILRVYERLSQVRREIEQVKGQMQYLERTSSMSLISVSLMPEVSAKPVISAGWSALEILKSAVRGIVTFGQWLVTLAIWLVIFSPIWGAVAGFIYWRRRKRKAA
ncbi:MAG: DUF4349 domain-containing protein [Chloroflexi bacterium]|nr:DUF4349 domain-containing protein [Chloroflexota bacterium]